MLLDNLKAVCSITNMANKLRLSRIRFYQLRKEGVFPEPVPVGCPERLLYPLELQQKCIEIRKTGIGLNGEPIIFNTPRTKKPKKSKRFKKSKNQPGGRYEELIDILRRWKWDVTYIDVKNAVNILYPEGLAQHTDEGLVLRDLIDYFKEGALKSSIKTVN
jgi:hypothetical protein